MSHHIAGFFQWDLGRATSPRILAIRQKLGRHHGAYSSYRDTEALERRRRRVPNGMLSPFSRTHWQVTGATLCICLLKEDNRVGIPTEGRREA